MTVRMTADSESEGISRQMTNRVQTTLTFPPCVATYGIHGSSGAASRSGTETGFSGADPNAAVCLDARLSLGDAVPGSAAVCECRHAGRVSPSAMAEYDGEMLLALPPEMMNICFLIDRSEKPTDDFMEIRLVQLARYSFDSLSLSWDKFMRGIAETTFLSIERCIKTINGQYFLCFSDYVSDIVLEIRTFNHAVSEECFICIYQGQVVRADLSLTEQSIPVYAVLECFIELKGGGLSKNPAGHSSVGNFFRATKRRCGGGICAADIGDCSPTSKGLAHTLQEESEINASEDPDGGRFDDARAGVSQEIHGIWVENIDMAKKAFVHINIETLQLITSVEGLEKAINNACVEQNKSSLTFLGLLQEADKRNLVIVVQKDREMEIKIKNETDPWRYAQLCEDRQGCQSKPVLISNACYHSFCFEHCSSKCKEILSDDRWSRAQIIPGTLYEYLTVTPPPKNHTEQCVGLIQNGLQGPLADNGQANAMGRKRQNQVVVQEHHSREEVSTTPAGQAAGRWYSTPFRRIIYPADIGLEENDRMVEKLSLAQLLLIQAYELWDKNLYVVRHSTAGKKITIDDGGDAYQYISIYCRSTGCTHLARYKLIPGKMDARQPVFIQVHPRDGLTAGHSCCQNESALDCTKTFRGKRTLNPDVKKKLNIARMFYYNGYPLRLVMLALGFDESNTWIFTTEQKRLYDQIRTVRRDEMRTQFPRLRARINRMLADGHLAFAAMDAAPRCEGKYRLYWKLIVNAYNSALGHNLLGSFDFKYLLLDGLAFGIITILSPSGNIIPNAMFIVESENKDSIAWIVDKYEKSIERLGLKSKPRVNPCLNVYNFSLIKFMI